MRPGKAQETQRKQWIFTLLSSALVALFLWQMLAKDVPQTKRVAYSELVSRIKAGEIDKVEIDEEEVVAQLRTSSEKQPAQLIATRIPGLSPDPLVQALEAAKIETRGKIATDLWWQSLLSWMVPLALMIAFLNWSMARANKRGGPLSFGRSKMKVYDRSVQEPVTFEDVAGVDEAEAELQEVVAFLKTPEKYRALGAHIPKGVLLLGPSGTGKTLLARAVAGEADVPFFSMSGSDFVEMFVGVGASRVRDLFEQAKQRAPCIVFIDELDAIGKSRGGLTAMGSNEEREQTLNQLLVEMDGFDAASGVVIMAATNRPEILDAALVRAGRFDRQVLVDRPDIRGRHDILVVHARKLKLAPDADLQVVAQRTPGMVGADLANLLNEAAISAARRGGQAISASDIEEAIDRVQLGMKKKNRVMSADEKRRIAFHEAGHSLVALSLPHADPVHRVTIIPRSIGALGATLQLPTQERYLVTRDELTDRMCVMLAGRAAEELTFGDSSTGAQNDLERASEIARQMVCRFGMSPKLGLVTYGRSQEMRFLETPFGAPNEQNFSEETAAAIDREVRVLIDTAYQHARRTLEDKRAALSAISERLLEIETLERDELERLAK